MTPHLARIFLWHVVRDIRRHPLLALLNVLSVALGIAVYLAIQIANHSANRSFASSVDVVAGKAHLEIRGAVEDSLLPFISQQREVKAGTPIIEGTVTLPDHPNEYLQVLGIDVFTNEPFRTFELRDAQQRFDYEEWLANPEGIAITRSFAMRHGIKAGETLRVLVNSVIRSMRVTFLMDLSNSPAAENSRFAAMDVGWAQELFGMRGKLSSIQLLLHEPRKLEEALRTLSAALPSTVRIAPPSQRSAQIEKMLGAFELNLTALSMVSMLVGMFLIYNTISASVVRRRAEIGILRSLGTTRGEVRALFLGEALLFGLIGIAAGMAAGVALANVLVGSVAKTISSLYVLLSIERQLSDPVLFLGAAAFGFAAVILAAWLPANEAARVQPIDALAMGTRAEQSIGDVSRYFWFGVVSLGLAGMCSFAALHSRWAVLGFVAAFFVLFGFALFAPALTRGVGALFAGLFSRQVLWRVAADNLRRSVHRNSITVAALTSAVAMMIGISVMIFSFRNTVDAWIEQTIVADLFIAPSSNEIIGLSAFIPPEAIPFLEKQPGVNAVDTFREATVEMAGDLVSVASIKGTDRRNLRFIGGGEREKMQRFFAGEGALVSESFSRKFGVRTGDSLALQTPRGPAVLIVAGVYYDYTSDRGTVALDHRTFEKWWDDPRVQSLAVYLSDGADAQEIAGQFQARFGGGGEFSIYPNRKLRERILATFDQTFAVTHVLRVIAVVVAVVGIFLSVTALVFERQREIGVLRAIGAARSQVKMLFVAESAMIGFIASVLGLAAGAVLAVVLTGVVNKAFFGWTIALEWPWTFLVTTPVWLVLVAAIAAWGPAHRAAKTRIASALRWE